MSESSLEYVEVETGRAPRATVLWLHGVGADGHHFEYLVREFTRTGDPPVRFVLPHAPRRPVTLAGMQHMRSWYDLRSVDRQQMQDEPAIRSSFAAVSALMAREAERGVSPERLLIGGFSQGGALALLTGTRYPQRLAGIVALSCYRLLAPSFQAERQPANQRTPVFLAHGSSDPVVPLQAGEQTLEQLRAAGYTVDWHTYPMGHELCAAETTDLVRFVRRALSLDPSR